MNLYIIILVEPKDKVSKGTSAGEEFFVSSGGLPGGETEGPWREEQRKMVSTAVQEWASNIPDDATESHIQQRTSSLSCLESENYSFMFQFHTGDDIDLVCFRKDTSALYETLQLACKGTDMVTTKFDSV